MIATTQHTEVHQTLQKLKSYEFPIPSLMNGNGGLVLLYAYAYKIFNEESYFEKASELLEKCLEQISNAPANFSLVNGLSGFSWLISHLQRIDFLEEDSIELLIGAEEIIHASFQKDLHNKNLDLFYGLIGKGIFYLEAFPHFEAKQKLEEIVNIIAQTAEVSPEGLYWNDSLAERTYPEEQVQNLGLAHGIPSIIAFLAQVYQKNICQEQIEDLLQKSINWLLYQRNPDKSDTGNWFPGVLRDQKSNPAAFWGWCHGDMGIALAIWQASQALPHQIKWKEQALELALDIAHRPPEIAYLHTHQSSGNCEQGFCHGASSLAHIFHRFYQASQIPIFEEQANYWLNKLPGAALVCNFDEEKEQEFWKKSHALLSGDAGIGLVKLSFMSNEPLPAWDIIFLTNI